MQLQRTMAAADAALVAEEHQCGQHDGAGSAMELCLALEWEKSVQKAVIGAGLKAKGS